MEVYLIMKKLLFLYIVTMILGSILSCKTIHKKDSDLIESEIKEKDPFLDAIDVSDSELFRVKITTTEYKIKQIRHFDKIQRVEDEKGDKEVIKKVKKYQGIIQIERIGIAELWLYPDTGKPMRIRIKKTTGLQEFDLLINEDLTRWRFKPIKSKKYPVMYVKYLIRVE